MSPPATRAGTCIPGERRPVTRLAATCGIMSPSDWFYVRGTECMWMRRSTSTPYELVIQGPGTLRRVGLFSSERELLDFERDLQDRLARSGWQATVH